jgi:predicted LPLAT superfamily acyltransferase
VSSSGALLQSSWASTRERGTLFMMRLMVLGLKLFSRPVTVPIVHLATLYFFVSGRRTRGASRDYLRRAAQAFPERCILTSTRGAYRHYLAFAQAMVDKLDAWAGRLDYASVAIEDLPGLVAAARGPRGALVIGSHLGNLEVCRALVHANRHVRLNVLIHNRHAPYFSRVLRLAGGSEMELLQVTELDATAALGLKERVDRGEWVVIAGDRVPVHGGRIADVEFLGGAAPLPVGPYVLAALLECPVHLLFCLRRGRRYHVYFEPFAPRVAWERSDRDRVLHELAQRFARRLEHYVQLEPLQWFNFYPFWRETGAVPGDASGGGRPAAS